MNKIYKHIYHLPINLFKLAALGIADVIEQNINI